MGQEQDGAAWASRRSVAMRGSLGSRLAVALRLPMFIGLRAACRRAACNAGFTARRCSRCPRAASTPEWGARERDPRAFPSTSSGRAQGHGVPRERPNMSLTLESLNALAAQVDRTNDQMSAWRSWRPSSFDRSLGRSAAFRSAPSPWTTGPERGAERDHVRRSAPGRPGC
jgi:hypothetical protein